jgi:putative DNA primase/helicase
MVGAYAWDTASGEPDDAVAELPAAWRNRVLLAARTEIAPPVDDHIAEGHRNTTLTSLAGSLRHRGMNHSVIQAALEAVNREQCRPPLSVDEVAQVARSVAGYPAGATAGTGGAPESDLLTGAVFGTIHLKVNQWVSKTNAEIHVRRDGELLLVDRVAPGSSRSRADLLRAVQQFEPAANEKAVQRALMALSARQPAATPTADVALQGRAVAFEPVEPWPESVDGAALIDDIVTTLHRHMSLQRAAAVVLALWIVAAHTYQRFDIFPRVVVRSPTKRCGKTRLLDLMATMLARCLACANVSLAGLFRSVEEYHPVLLLDEVDRYLKTTPELIGLLNAGHKRGASVLRCVGEDSEPRAFDVFCPVVMAGIGDAPDTLMDRAHVIELQRRARADSVAPLRARDLAEVKSRIVPRIIRWVADHDAELQEAQPEVPGGLDDRAADNAVPLLAVADIVGGEWPLRARSAIVALSGCRQETDDCMGLLLLGDLRELFDERAAAALPTKTILTSLFGREDRPWREWGSRGRPITAWHVGRMLEEFGITSAFVQDAGARRKLRGYRRADLQDAWSRYGFDDPLRDSVPSAISSTKTAANGETGLRSTPPLERSVDSPFDAGFKAGWPDPTESRSGTGDGFLADLSKSAPRQPRAPARRGVLRLNGALLRSTDTAPGGLCCPTGPWDQPS